jgi:hypothetical protein
LGGASNTQSRPGTSTSDTGSESKNTSQGQSDGKGVRQTTGRAPAQTAQPDDSGRGNQQPAEDDNTKKSRTRDRRGGGGGR